MSWLGGYKPKPSSSTASGEAERKKLEADRDAKRKKLEADRQLRIKQRNIHKQRLQAAIEARQEADQALQDILELDPDIFAEDNSATQSIIAEDEVEDILADSGDEMADFDQEDGTDGAKAIEKLSTLQCPFNKEDLEFWFSELEGQLEMIEVKAQWTKIMALRRLLPVEIKEEVKSILKLTKTQAGVNIYHRCKLELMDLFGKKPEDDYIRAKNRKLTGKPSQLGKKLVDDICPGEVKLQGCHCAKTVWAMFREELPVVIRNHISEMTFTATTYKQVFAKADQVWSSNQNSDPVSRPAIAEVKLDSPSDAEAGGAVAAVGFRNRGNRGGKPARNQGQSGGGQGGGNKPQKPAQPAATSAKPKGTRHPTAKGKDENLCKIHFTWGVNGNYCAAPWKCPMKDTFKAPQ